MIACRSPLFSDFAMVVPLVVACSVMIAQVECCQPVVRLKSKCLSCKGHWHNHKSEGLKCRGRMHQDTPIVHSTSGSTEPSMCVSNRGQVHQDTPIVHSTSSDIVELWSPYGVTRSNDMLLLTAVALSNHNCQCSRSLTRAQRS